MAFLFLNQDQLKKPSLSYFRTFLLLIFVSAFLFIAYTSLASHFQASAQTNTPIKPGLTVNGATLSSSDNQRFVFKGVNIEF